jgi:hypothetical protein
MKLSPEFLSDFQQLNVAIVEELNGMQNIPTYNELTVEDLRKGVNVVKEKVKIMEDLLEKTVK